MTLDEHYGIPHDQEVDDVTWLAETARRGWIVVAKDARIRRRPAERETIRVDGARCFYFTRGDLPARVYADRFLHSLPAIERACEDEGPVCLRHPPDAHLANAILIEARRASESVSQPCPGLSGNDP